MPVHDIAALRLRNQCISWTDFTRPEEVVDRLVAVQAQDYAAAKWALGMRLQNATEEAVEEAFNRGSILRTHLLRPTWHFVTPADIRWLLELTAPRVQAANAGIYRRLGLTEELLKRANKVMEKGLEGGKQLTRDELRDVLKAAGFGVEPNLHMIYFLMNAELDGILCSGARRGRQFTYALLEERVPAAHLLGREEALAALAGSYFATRGPASDQDFAKWSGLTLTDARAGLEAVKDQLENATIQGREYWFPPVVDIGQRPTPRACLLSIYDEFISSYKDISAAANPADLARMRALGNALTRIIVFDGRVVGAWRRQLHPRLAVIEAQYFIPPPEAMLQAVEEAAREFGRFLGVSVEIVSFPPSHA